MQEQDTKNNQSYLVVQKRFFMNIPQISYCTSPLDTISLHISIIVLTCDLKVCYITRAYLRYCPRSKYITNTYKLQKSETELRLFDEY